jgi:Apea-like HEPN
MLPIIKPEPSRYIRTTWMISAQIALKFADSSKIRFFSSDEADRLAEQVIKRNVFSRHSWENNFYLQRVKELANHTIIEVFRPGDPRGMSDEAETVASILEKLTILSTTVALRKIDLQRKLGISSKPRTETDFILSPDYHFLRSRARPAPTVQGILVDETFSRRFSRCGFDTITDYIQSNSDISKRVLLSLDWLFDSRIEPRLQASVVKTSIALESLLIFNESESLAQSLSERAAFIMSSDPNRRQQISRLLKRFYDARSGVVHGSQKKAKKLNLSLLETVDRLTVLLCLIIATNSKLWSTTEILREWCETQRWGKPSSDVKIPFPDIYLRNVLVAGEREMEQRT